MKRNVSLIILFTVISVITSVSVGKAFWNRDVKKAKEFMQAGMYPKAIELLNKRIIDKPADAEAHFLLGICYIKTGKIRDADQRFASAVRLNSGYGYKKISKYINPDLTDDEIKLILIPVDALLRFVNGEYTKELLQKFVYYEDPKEPTEADLNLWIKKYKNVKAGSMILKLVYITFENENTVRIVAITSSTQGEEKIEPATFLKINNRWYQTKEKH